MVEAPFGAHPCQMPYRYFFDEDIIGEWLNVSRTEEGAKEFFDKYVFSVKDFSEYLEIIGGKEKLEHLRKVEVLEEPMTAPWLKKE